MAISDLQMGLVGAGGVVVVGIFAFNKLAGAQAPQQMDALSSLSPLGSEAKCRHRVRRRSLSRSSAVRRRRAPSQCAGRQDASARRCRRCCRPRWTAGRLGGAHRGHRAGGRRPSAGSRPLSTSRASPSPCAGSVFRIPTIAGMSSTPAAAAITGCAWRCNWWTVAVRPADELTCLTGGLQRMCDLFMAIPSLPAKADALDQAAELDRLCWRGYPDRRQCGGAGCRFSPDQAARSGRGGRARTARATVVSTPATNSV